MRNIQTEPFDSDHDHLFSPLGLFFHFLGLEDPIASQPADKQFIFNYFRFRYNHIDIQITTNISGYHRALGG